MHTYLFHVPIKYIKLTAKRNEREREKEEEGKKRGRGRKERGGERRVHTIFYKYLYQISLMENHLYGYKILLFICIFLLFNKLITIMNF